jgi:chemotaxis signal transduction protein
MSETTVRWLRFQDAGQSYAVDESRVRSVEGSQRLQLNPGPGGTAGWLLGVEGDLPVASLARAGQAGGEQRGRRPAFRRPGPGGQVIVLDTGAGTAGLWVDAVSAPDDIPVSRLRHLPPVARTGLFRRMAKPAVSAGVTGDIVLEIAPEAIREQVAEGDFRPAQVSAGAGGSDRQAGAQAGRERRPGSDIEPASESSGEAGPDSRASRDSRDSETEAEPDLASSLAAAAPSFELPPARGEGERRLLLFTTGRPQGLPFGLNARQALEMLRPRQVRPVPGAPPYLLGLVSWRGEPIAALDLEVRLGLAHDPATVRRLLVVRSWDQEAVAAFVVDRVVAILQQPFRARRLPAPPAARADLLRGAFEEAGHPFIVPDIDRVLRLPPAAAEPAEVPDGAPSYWA